MNSNWGFLNGSTNHQKKINTKHSEKCISGYGISKVNIQFDQY